MHLDVLDLRNFYYRTGIGRSAQRAIRDQLVRMWPDARGQTVAGFGFAVPLLRPYLGQARRVVGLMPGQQGVMPWPAGMPNVSALCEEGHWPLGNGAVDKLVLLHGLETSDDHRVVLREAARVLADGGRAMFIVPNRRGLWARGDGTPFGYGRSYSLGQIEAQLVEYGFRPERHATALFAPPSTRRFWLRTAPFWEGLGRGVSSYLAGGVLMVEAVRHTDEPARGGLREAVRRPMRILEGLGNPAPEPARRAPPGNDPDARGGGLA